ncbi:MAG: S1/P1 nuclease, partial [Bacteroidota bacterium]|nr:S1/P1 nuclease [Bacteroidota bacterium]
MKTVKVILLCAVLYLPFFCFAWGTEGHRVCGEIASHHLTKKAQLTIASILGDESIAMASNWADFIKADTVYNYLSSWHYIDLPDHFNYASLQTYLKEDTATDAYTKINFLSAQLKNKQLPKDKKVMYIKLLIHLVEDIHQPLHTIGTEKGGNGIKVSWFNESSNLHKMWDSDLILF